jgi:hypothetical protein
MKKNTKFTVITLAIAIVASSQLAAMAQHQPGGALWQEDADWRAAHAQLPQRQLTVAEREAQEQEARRRKGVEIGQKRRQGLGGEAQEFGRKTAHELAGSGTIIDNRLENPIRVKSALGLPSTVKPGERAKLQSGIQQVGVTKQLKIEIMSAEKSGVVVGEFLFNLKEITRHLSAVNTVIVHQNQTLTIQGVLKEGGKFRDKEFAEWAFNNMKTETEQSWREDSRRWLRGLYTVLVADLKQGRVAFMIERGAFLDLYCNYGLQPRERGAGAADKDSGAPYCSMDRSTRAGLERSVIISNIRPLRRGPTPPASPRPGGLVPEERVPAGYNQL